MGTKPIDDRVRKELKRQGAQPDVEDEIQVTGSSDAPATNDGHQEGHGQPGGHGRGGKSSRR